ncbi:hypothetical protein [Microbacterium sp. LWH3-1.2]
MFSILGLIARTAEATDAIGEALGLGEVGGTPEGERMPRVAQHPSSLTS